MHWQTLPNLLTLSRIAVVPVVYFLWFYEMPVIAAIVAAVVASTDFFDGYLARRMHQETLFGAILDPVADKCMIVSISLLLLYADILPVWLVFFVVLRNVSQLLAIPVLMWWKKIPFQVRPKLLPKLASALGFVILVVGLLLCSSEMRANLHLTVYHVLFGVFLLQSLFEAHILFTFWPRFYLIFNRRHDAFE